MLQGVRPGFDLEGYPISSLEVVTYVKTVSKVGGSTPDDKGTLTILWDMQGNVIATDYSKDQCATGYSAD